MFLLILFSSLTGMILSLSTDTSSTTSKLYLYSQAKLLARSGIEIAILMVENRGDDKNCLESINIEDGEFNTTVNISYIGVESPNCKDKNITFKNNYALTKGTILLDVFVETAFETEHIKFHRRVAQKP